MPEIHCDVNLAVLILIIRQNKLFFRFVASTQVVCWCLTFAMKNEYAEGVQIRKFKHATAHSQNTTCIFASKKQDLKQAFLEITNIVFVNNYYFCRR